MRVLRLLKWTLLVLPLVLVAIFAIAWWRSDNDCAARASSTPKVPMRALVYCDYGTPDVLTIAQVEKPVPQETQVLVRVRAASVNPLDWHMIRGTPYVMRMDSGLRKPAVTRTGVDFAGVVEAVGRQVSRFKVGDEVFGGRTGALAEYVVVSADRAIVHKPAIITFDQAAAVGVAGLTALQGIRDRGQVRKGQRVLINGASGGVGTFAVQIAETHRRGGHRRLQHAQRRPRSFAWCRSRDRLHEGRLHDAHRRIRRAPGQRGQPSALRVPASAHAQRSLRARRRRGAQRPPHRRPARPSGLHLPDEAVRPARDGHVHRRSESPRSRMVRRRDGDRGRVSVIDRRYPFAQAAEAMRYLESGRARGKVIVTMD